MKILYVRVSSIDQKTDRQKVLESRFNRIVEDRCSGSVPFLEREGGKEIRKLIDRKAITSVSVVSIDRLGRNLKDVLSTIEYFNHCQIPIHFLSQGLVTLDEQGNENSIAKMIISILGVVAEMERNQIRERQRDGIQLAKQRGDKYLGRKVGSKEDMLRFLSKPKNRHAVDYIRKGYKLKEISKILDLNVNTLTKIKKAISTELQQSID